MKLRKLVQAVAGVLAATALSAAAQQPAGKLTDDVIKIGVLTDMSGLYADLGGAGAVLAARMAVEDFGGKMFGKTIEIVQADHQNKADIAKAKATEWFDKDKVDIMVENLNSAVALAVSATAKEKGKIALVTGAASSRLTNEDCSPGSTIHWVYNTIALANGTAGAVLKQGGDSWFFLTADYAFGHSLEKDAAGVVTAGGGKVLGAVRHPLNTTDFSSFLLQAQASKAKIIGLANAGGDTINSIKAANEFGITKNQSLAGLLVFITDIHSLGLKTTQGMYLTDGWYWDMNDDSRKWAKRFFEKQKKMPSMSQAGVYSGVMHYLNAVKAAGTDETTAVIKKMRETPINDMFAKNGKLREDGLMQHDMLLAQVKKPEESKYPWDYFHIRQVIPGEQAFGPLSASKCPALKKS